MTERDRTCSTAQKCIQNFNGKTREKEDTMMASLYKDGNKPLGSLKANQLINLTRL